MTLREKEERRLEDEGAATHYCPSTHMMTMKKWLFYIADWIDDKVLCHRVYWVCTKLALSDWWDR